MPVCVGGAEDGATGRGVEGGALDGVAAHRRRWQVRVSLSAGRMGEGLPVCGVAVTEESKAEGGERTRAIPIVRHAGIQLSGARDRLGCSDRRGGGVLPATGGG